MISYALIKDGMVINVLIADETFMSSYAKDIGCTYVEYEKYNAHVGFTTTDGLIFIDPNPQP